MRCATCPGLACRHECVRLQPVLSESDLRVGVTIRWRTSKGTVQEGRVHEIVEPFCEPRVASMMTFTRLRPERMYIIEVDAHEGAGIRRRYRIPRLDALLATGELIGSEPGTPDWLAGRE